VTEPQVIAAIIAGLVALTVAVLGLMGVMLPLLIQTRQHARRADVQVSNNHPTNLREEADERHDENRRSLVSLSRQLNDVAGSVRGIQRDVGRLWDTDLDHQTRIHDLEQTRPKVIPDHDPHPYPRRRDLREARRP
jgi:hypothetical protein